LSYYNIFIKIHYFTSRNGYIGQKSSFLAITDETQYEDYNFADNESELEISIDDFMGFYS